MEQEVKLINIKDLVLWTENPRDPINENAVDQDIVDRALEDGQNKWSLAKLAKEMGDYYDFSELPTVVYHKKKPVVYDGNRRIVLGKIKHGIVKVNGETNILLPEFPEKIPCNVCSKEIALNNVYRKHRDTGSWKPLERDIFLYEFMHKEKSLFFTINEKTNIISSNPHLNQGYVKKEIFTEENLKNLGFTVKDGDIFSVHNNEESHSILTDISNIIKTKDITTRKNRGKVLERLEPSSQKLINENKNNEPQLFNDNFNKTKKVISVPIKIKRQSQRTQKKETEIFGGSLYLRKGKVSDLYRDIFELYNFYIKEKNKLSQYFSCLIRMALRLLCETAAKEDSHDQKLDKYLKNNFTEAKNKLDQDTKATLSASNITKESIVSLLHIGAHNYTAAKNFDQTMALSIIIGEILTLTFGKDS
ncbi:MAG: hypothetical protein WCS73_05660 [Lentisphaeria bacterium]